MNNTTLETILHKIKKHTPYIKWAAAGLVFIAAVSFVYFVLPSILTQEYNPMSAIGTRSGTSSAPQEEEDIVTHVDTPDQVKGVYMTACAARTPSFRDHITNLIEDTEINAVIIDIKDFTGTLSPSLGESLDEKNTGAEGCRVSDMKEFIAQLHEREVYVIGRITAFQDPFYTKQNPDVAIKEKSTGELWKDNKGLSYIDPGSRKAWDYLVEIGKESYKIGFDELNYDYIRYPSDGDIGNVAYPISAGREKPVVIREFFEYLNNKLEPVGVPVSADIFGMTTTAQNDLNIGQKLEDALATFDYVAPMVYPSHYPPGYQGFSNPAQYPYEIIQHSMGTAVLRTRQMAQSTTTPQKIREHVSADQLRPWLQDFDLGADYTPSMVRKQIQATYDVGLDSWMLWDPRNTYTREALNKATSSNNR